MIQREQVYFGFSVPRRGRKLEIQEDDTWRDVLAATYVAFEVSTNVQYDVFVILRESREVLGTISDADVSPFAMIESLAENKIDYELVFLPIVEPSSAAAAAADEPDYARLPHAGRSTPSRSSSKKSHGKRSTPRTPRGGAPDDSEQSTTLAEMGDAAQLDLVTANRLADKLARRIAKLEAYIDDRAQRVQEDDERGIRKLMRAQRDVDKHSEQLVLIEEQIAMLELIEESTGPRDDTTLSSSTDSQRARSRHKARRPKKSGGESSRSKSSGERRRKPSLEQMDEYASSSADDEASGNGSTRVELVCEMCEQPFVASVTALGTRKWRWVYAPAHGGNVRLTVCKACHRGAQKEEGASSNAQGYSIASSAQFEARLVAFDGPPEPALYSELGVPRATPSPQNRFKGVVFVPPDVVVSQFKDSGSLHISFLTRNGVSVLARQSVVVSLRVCAPYVLSFHADNILQVIDVQNNTHELKTTLLDCSGAFAGETQAATRALVANERWVAVASQERVCLWPWRLLLSAREHATPPARTIALPSNSAPRDDFCHFAQHLLLVGGNRVFSVWDVLLGVCVYRFDFGAEMHSFYGMRFAGQNVVTREMRGIRVWRVGDRVSEALRLSGAASVESLEVIEPEQPPLIEADAGTTVSAFYADHEIMLMGDGRGRVRVRSIAAASADSGGARPAGRSSKLDKLLGNDAESMPIEYLCVPWPPASDKKSKRDKKAALESSGSAGGGGGGSSKRLLATRGVAAMDNKINFIARDGDRVFCAQNNGWLVVWSLLERDATEPLAKYRGDAPARWFATHKRTVMFAFNNAADDDHGESGGGGGGGGLRRSKSSKAKKSLEATPVEPLSVVVGAFGGAQQPSMAELAALPPLPPLKHTNGVLAFAIDAQNNGQLAGTTPRSLQWETTVAAGFAALASRTAAQRCHLLAHSRLRLHKSEARAAELQCQVRVCESNELSRILRLDGTLARTWHAPVAEAPFAEMVCMPGAHPVHPISVYFVLLASGMTKVYRMHAAFGVVPTPSKIWSFVNRTLVATVVAAQKNGGTLQRKKKSSAFSSFFSSSKKK